MEYSGLLHLMPALDDDLIGGCGDYHKVIGKEEGVRSFAASAKRWLDKEAVKGRPALIGK
jgi:hypothetical protein